MLDPVRISVPRVFVFRPLFVGKIGDGEMLLRLSAPDFPGKVEDEGCCCRGDMKKHEVRGGGGGRGGGRGRRREGGREG